MVRNERKVTQLDRWQASPTYRNDRLGRNIFFITQIDITMSYYNVRIPTDYNEVPTVHIKHHDRKNISQPGKNILGGT